MKNKSFFLLIFIVVVLLYTTPQARIIESVWGRQTPSDTRTEEERQIVFHTDMEDTVLQKALESPHSICQEAGVVTALEKIGRGKKISPGVKQALKQLSTQPIRYETDAYVKVALVLTNGQNKTSQGKQLAEYFKEEETHALKKTAIFYAGKMGYDSLLSQLSSKLDDKSMGLMDVDSAPYEGIFHYAQAAIDQINASKLPKEKRVKYLVDKFIKGQTRARQEVLIDLGEEAIPTLISQMTTSFENGSYYDNHIFLIAQFILLEMNISDSNATKVLIPYLSNQSGPLRDLCIRALAGIGTEEAIPYIQKVTPVDKWLQKDLSYIIEGIRTRAAMEKKISNR